MNSNNNNKMNDSSFFNGLVSLDSSKEENVDNRTFPYYTSKDSVEDFINEMDEINKVLKDLFYKLGDGGAHLQTNEKNEIIENILVQIDKVKNEYSSLYRKLESDKNSIKSLQLMYSADLSAFDRIFDDK